jgi:DNA invertase Pin-like site-specific DNA recombinase
MIAAYTRVSSRAQDLASQTDAISRACAARGEPIGRWYTEKRSAKTIVRPELDRLRRDARSGEVEKLYVFRIDRLTRSGIRDTLEVVQELKDHGCSVVSIADGFDLQGPGAELVLAVMAWAAQMERLALRERIAASRETVEAKGGAWGRPRRLTDREIADAAGLVASGMSIRAACRQLRISHTTLQRTLNRKLEKYHPILYGKNGAKSAT